VRAWRPWAQALIVVALGALLVAGVWRWSRDAALAQSRDSAQAQLRFIAHDLGAALDKYEMLPQVLATHPVLKGLLAQPQSPARRDEVNALLTRLTGESGVAAIFLIDGQGLTLASSNWDSPQSYVGEHYAYRPYFRDALARGSGYFYARGATTGTPGYFLAHRLDGGAPGVVVVKVSLDEMEANWARGKDQLMLADEQGVVFLASRPEWKYRSLRPLSPAARARLQQTQQYGALDVQPLAGHEQLQGAAGGLRIARLALSPEPVDRPAAADGARATPTLRALVTEQALPRRGWTLLSLTEVRGELQIATGRAWAAALGWLALLLAWLYWQLRRRRAHERAAARGELQRVHASLEQRISERTADLLQANEALAQRVDELHRTETTLRATQDELVQAGKLAVLGQMAASITHEINQPLAALRALNDNAQVFLERGQPEQAQDNLRAIAGLTQRVAGIVAHLKGFARRDELCLQPVDVAAAIQSAAALVGAEARRHGVQLQLPKTPAGLAVQGQPVRIEQVLVNLLRNAIDACAEMPPPQRLVEVLVHPPEVPGAPHALVAIQVRDQGPGISPAALGHLFEPFFTTKRRGEGLGLGLSISASIANALGGSLQGGNAPGGGAVFTLRLRPAQACPAQPGLIG
jgi:two-component system C4-dicarboxylate transport sensor histidine kinase DctB